MSNPGAADLLTMPDAPRSFHVMAKPTGATCNLDCEYCFFLSKEMLYPDSRFRMATDLLETYVRQLIEAQPNAPEIIMAWQGGEPTMMGLDFFRLVVELQARYARPGQSIRNTLQTNGTLLTDEWGEFLAQHEFLVGISIDGPKEIHDAYRVDKGGKPTFDRVMRGLDVLKRHSVEWNVLTTIHAANGDHGRAVYTFLRDALGADFIQFIPIIERATAETLQIANNGWGDGVVGRPLYTQDGSLVTERSVTAEQYGSFMVDVFEEWVRRDIGRVFLQLFDTTLAHFYGASGGMCVHAETCGTLLAIEHNGDLYSCDHYVEPDYLLGNIKERPLLDLIVLSQQTKFGQDKRDTLTRQCLSCDVRFACNGGCPKDRFIESMDGEPGLHYLCDGYQHFFRHVAAPMAQMAQLLRMGRAPYELMDDYARQDAQRPRNSACPCGNGKKWKRCHGGPVGTSGIRET